jgi:hypothetical protein
VVSIVKTFWPLAKMTFEPSALILSTEMAPTLPPL